MPYKLAVRAAFTPEAKPSIRVERLIDGLIYDFKNLAFAATPDHAYSLLYEVVGVPGLFADDVFVDGEGPYSVTLHESFARECVMQMSMCADPVPPVAATAP